MKIFPFPRLAFLFLVFFISGCPKDENPSATCKTVTVCQDDRESYCDEPKSGACVKSCYYFVYENCWEMCEDDARKGGYINEPW